MKKILTLMMVTLLIALSVVPAFADDPTPPKAGEDSNYTELKGEKTEFKKYLITNEGQEIPDLEFKYTIEPGKAVPAIYYVESTQGTEGAIEITADNKADYTDKEGKEFEVGKYVIKKLDDTAFEIFAGVGTPTIGKAVFGETDLANHQKLDEIADEDKASLTNLPEGKVYSKDTVEIDFKGVTFTEPGIYRYIITEQELEDSSIEAVSYDTEADNSMKRVLDVYVVDNEGILEVDSYVLHKTESEIVRTEENGSKDQKAVEDVVESKWVIVGFENDFGPYDTKEEAEEKLAELKSTSTDPAHYDQAIVDLQGQIDTTKSQIEALEQQIAAADTTAEEAAVTAAEKTLKDLQEGTTGAEAPSDTIENLLKAIDYTYYVQSDSTNTEAIQIADGESANYNAKDGSTPFNDGDYVLEKTEKDIVNFSNTELKKHGRDNLYDYLVKCTDAYEIQVLRTAIEQLDTAIATAKADLEAAEQALETAQAPVKDKIEQKEGLETTLGELTAKMTALVAAHNAADVAEVQQKIWKLSDKSDSYVNEISTYNLVFSKEVTGNQGSKDKYFKFTLKLTGLRAASVYYREATEAEAAVTDDTKVWVEADGSQKDKSGTAIETGKKVVKVDVPASVVKIDSTSKYTKTPSGNTATVYDAETMKTANNITELTAELDATTGKGTIEHDFYLKHGEYIVLKDLPSGITYEITEDAEDYKYEEKTNIEVGKVEVGAAKWYVIATPGTDLTNTDFSSNLSGYFTDSQKSGYTKEGLNKDTYEWFVGWGELKGTPGQACQDDASGTLTKNIYTGYTNTKNGIIPTGVLMSVTGGAVLIVIAIAALIILNRRRAEDEE